MGVGSVLAIVLAAFWVLSGHAQSAERLVPTDKILQFSNYVGDASSETIIFVLLAAIACSVLVWLVVCLLSWTFLSVVEGVDMHLVARRRASRPSTAAVEQDRGNSAGQIQRLRRRSLCTGHASSHGG